MPAKLSLREAAALIKDGMTVMFGGFMGCGTPHNDYSEFLCSAFS